MLQLRLGIEASGATARFIGWFRRSPSPRAKVPARPAPADHTQGMYYRCH